MKNKIFKCFCSLTIVTLVSACGYKGDLYLPPKPNKIASNPVKSAPVANTNKTISKSNASTEYVNSR